MKKHQTQAIKVQTGRRGGAFTENIYVNIVTKSYLLVVLLLRILCARPLLIDRLNLSTSIRPRAPPPLPRWVLI